MYWDPQPDTVRFTYYNEVVGYHPYLNVAFSALGYLLFALVIVGSQMKGIFKSYVHTVFLILAYAFVIDVFETGQTLYFIFNLPDKSSFNLFTNLKKSSHSK
ncbi:hypothetical protein PRIPAC_85514 [Pristionchus pacificus]|uniref:Uncharacterized protein n=1 Tax=Pristionchus pacificus TaxID=54126 RepID=A0A2A6BSW6_PRIPA|nr:hypothetical protein PRIPAC_85514 [Pristionchus pacificus]|eukprot:PDM69062.1 hypothetical protein PRIPAC_47364 [Pristionchus pacificus]